MVCVYLRSNEKFEDLLRRFKQVVEKDGILAEIRDREFYISPSELKHRNDQKRRYRLRQNKGRV